MDGSLSDAVGAASRKPLDSGSPMSALEDAIATKTHREGVLERTKTRATDAREQAA
jgi:hypothetical protein